MDIVPVPDCSDQSREKEWKSTKNDKIWQKFCGEEKNSKQSTHTYHFVVIATATATTRWMRTIDTQNELKICNLSLKIATNWSICWNGETFLQKKLTMDQAVIKLNLLTLLWMYGYVWSGINTMASGMNTFNQTILMNS